MNRYQVLGGLRASLLKSGETVEVKFVLLPMSCVASQIISPIVAR